MEAFILAAGNGTRLRPLTNTRPKALVEVDGISLLEYNLQHIIHMGAERVVINVHHFAEQIIRFIGSRSWDAEVLISDEREMLLNTGGGLKKAAPLFSGRQPILIHNVDILSFVDIKEMLAHHLGNHALATLAVSERNTSRQLLFDEARSLAGWENQSSHEIKWASVAKEGCRRLAFSGISIVQPELLTMLPEAVLPYPIIPEYLRIANQHTISAFEHDSSIWIDVGKPETLPLAHQFLPQN